MVPAQAGLSFTTRTEWGFMDMPKMTTLMPMNGSFGGAIDWKKKTMEVNGVAKPVAEVKRKLGGALSL